MINVPVAHETIIGALKDIEKLESLSLENLTLMSRNPLLPFPEELRKNIYFLLEQLMDDTREHQKLIHKAIGKLKDADTKPKSRP